MVRVSLNAVHLLSIYYLFNILYCFMYTQENNLRPALNRNLVAVADDAPNNVNDNNSDQNINPIIEVNHEVNYSTY